MCPDDEPMDSEDGGFSSQAPPHSPLPQHQGASQQPCTPPQLLAGSEDVPWTSPHLQQVTAAEYREQSVSFTQEALRQLKASPEYKQHIQQCHTCGSSWYGGEWNEQCEECGGHAMSRPCPVCRGHCGRMWRRNIDMSQSRHQAYWDGQCGLSEAEQARHMVQAFVDANDQLTEALEDLSTS